MKTLKTELFPAIDWDVKERFDPGMHHADGVSEDGRIWYGVAIVLNGEVEEITNIEPVCVVCGDRGETVCTPEANCLNTPNK